MNAQLRSPLELPYSILPTISLSVLPNPPIPTTKAELEGCQKQAQTADVGEESRPPGQVSFIGGSLWKVSQTKKNRLIGPIQVQVGMMDEASMKCASDTSTVWLNSEIGWDHDVELSCATVVKDSELRKMGWQWQWQVCTTSSWNALKGGPTRPRPGIPSQCD